MGMFYRKDLFEKEGIPVPATWDEFAAAAEKIHALGASITNFSVSSGEIPPFVGLVAQAGGNWFQSGDDGWTVDFTGAESAKVAEYWQSLLAKGYISTVPGFTDSWNAAYNAGEVWTWFSGAWGANSFIGGTPDLEGDWAVAPLPQWNAGANLSAPWGGSSTAVFQFTEHPYEAAKFALWLNTDAEALKGMVGLGQFPATSTLRAKVPSLSEGLSFFGGQAIYADFASYSENSASFTWGPTMTQVFSDVADAFSAVIAGNGTLLEGLATAQGKTVDTLKAAGIPVKQ
jgi:multiple sugar transport system substrate-binding protein